MGENVMGENIMGEGAVTEVENKPMKFAAIYLAGNPEHIAGDVFDLDDFGYGEIVVVFRRDRLSYQDVAKELQRREYRSRVTMAQVLEEADDLELVDFGVGYVKESTFYVVARPDRERRLPHLIERAIREKGQKFIGVKPASGDLDGLAFHVVSHRRALLGGNAEMQVENADGTVENYRLITDKVERFQADWYADRENPPKLLTTWEELYA